MTEMIRKLTATMLAAWLLAAEPARAAGGENGLRFGVRRSFSSAAHASAMDSAPVHLVLGRRTTYVAGRRLLLEGDAVEDCFHLTEQALKSLPAPTRDRSREMVLRTQLLGEGPANLLAAVVAPLLMWRRYWWSFAIAAAITISLTVWGLIGTASVGLAALTWSSVALHYLVLLGIVAWHELGHLAAARRAGLRVDGVGVGLYLVFPALFSNISLMVLAPYPDRMKVYAAGVMFQLMLGGGLAAALLLVPDPLLRFAVVANLSTLVINMVPGAKLDGHRMIDEVIAQPWSRRHRPALRSLTHISSTGLMALALMVVGSWLWNAIPAVIAGPSLLGVVSCLFPAVLLTLVLVSLTKSLRRRRV